MIQTSRAKGTRYTIKLYNNGKLVYSTDTKRIGRFLNLGKETSWTKAYLKVVYKPGVYNDGMYSNRKDLDTAFEQFVNRDLIEYANTHQF